METWLTAGDYGIIEVKKNTYTGMLSANRQVKELVEDGKLLIFSKNSIGPKVEPWTRLGSGKCMFLS